MADGSPLDPRHFELFKLCVELADRTSARRAGANTFFVSLHSVVAAVVGYIAAVHGPEVHADRWSLAVLSAIGVVLSLTWWGILRYYRRLSKAKWQVINDLEVDLPAQPFTDEWSQLHPEGEQSGWFRRHKHREATVVEQVVPWAFAVAYLIIGLRTTLL